MELSPRMLLICPAGRLIRSRATPSAEQTPWQAQGLHNAREVARLRPLRIARLRPLHGPPQLQQCPAASAAQQQFR